MAAEKLIREFLEQGTIAVVGVSTNRGKYGWIVFDNLRQRDYVVLPVNPNHETIDGERCYATVADLPPGVGGVVTVVPPAVTRQVVQEALQAGLKRFWMQPGSEDEQAIAAAKAAGAAVIAGECIMLHSL